MQTSSPIDPLVIQLCYSSHNLDSIDAAGDWKTSIYAQIVDS